MGDSTRCAAQKRSVWQTALRIIGAAIFTFVFSPFILLWLLVAWGRRMAVHLAVWRKWLRRGRCVLFVFSDNPLWAERIRGQVLPRLGERAVTLNWSERGRWDSEDLAVRVFRVYSGRREFNPLAVVFRPLRPARVFRFYRPYDELARGRPDQVERMERELFELADAGVGKG